MKLWRLARQQFTALDGKGGLFASGRWHNRGRLVIYAAESVPGAALEILAHLEIDPQDMPQYQLLAIEIPDSVATESAGPLPAGWKEDQSITRSIGDAWLDAGSSLLLRVPSAIAGHTDNWLINPSHPDAIRLTIVVNERFSWDDRLLRK